MASIDKLLVKGIRSFDPDHGAVIRFYKPLTIIVGQNGAGKTTIIEALKYATTGDMPPNSKGGAFIHDPKVIKRNEVTAQVQLRFTNLNEDPVECHRSIQLIQNKTKTTVKTLDSVFYTFDSHTNEKKSVTLRAADLGDEMVQNLGVSKAILDYVIFCHQEESNWPLSDSSTLKKKFDEIFASAEYTKLLEHMVKTEKLLVNEAKELRNTVKLVEKDLDSAKKIKQEVSDIEEQIQESNIKVEQINSNLEKVNSVVESLEEKTTRLITIENEIKLFKVGYNKLQDEINKIRSSFTELDLSDQELLTKKDETERMIAGIKEKKSVLNKQKTELEAKYNSLQNELREERFRHGQMKSNYEQYESYKKEFIGILSDLRPQLDKGSNIDDSDEFDEDSANICFSLLKEQITSDRLILDKIKADSRSKKTTVSDDLQRLLIDENSYQKGLAVFENKQRVLTQRLKAAQSELDSIVASRLSLGELEKNLDEKIELYEEANSKYLEEDYEEKISCKTQELVESEQQLQLASQKAESFVSMVDPKVLLDMRKEQQQDIKSRMDRLIMVNKKHFEKYLKHIPLPQSIGLQVQNTLSAVRNDLREASLQHLDIISSLSKAEGQFSLLQNIISKKQTESIDLQTQIQNICGSQSLSAALLQSEAILQEKESLLNQTKGIESVYADFLMKSLPPNPDLNERKEKRQKTRHDCDTNHLSSCPLCDMTFDKRTNADHFIDSLTDKKQSLENKIRTLNIELEREKTRHNMLKKNFSLWERLERLRSIEIPELEADQRMNAESAIKFRQESGHKLNEIEEIRLSLSDLEKLIKPVSEISVLDVQSRQLSEEISQSKLCDENTQSSAHGDTVKYVAQCALLRKELKALEVSHKEASDTISSLKADVDNSRRVLDEEKSKLDQISQLTTQRTDFQEEIDKDLQKFEDLKNKTSNLSSEISAKRKELAEIQNAEDEQLQGLQKKLDFFSEKRSRLSQIEETLKKKANGSSLLDLSRVVDSVEQKESNLKSLEARLEKISEDLKEYTNEHDVLLEKHQNILVNIDFCQKNNELNLKEAERSVLEQQYINNDFEKFKQELKRKMDLQADLRDQRASLNGELSQLEKTKNAKGRDLKINYKDVESLVRSQKQAEQAHLQKIEDLSKYNKLLDAMIMKFHSLKMAEINKIIQELWANTYFGSDITTIRIKSDAEKQVGRGTYNYRVVMVKDNVELDMRGRCSAGQKVLSSIIIRLALAEAFGADCGVLALDEPTTNLDRDNISSLAKSLVSIIKSRQNQKNFQLVIITHDEAFTSELGHSEFTEYYWALSKQNGQFSRVTRNRIADLF